MANKWDKVKKVYEFLSSNIGTVISIRDISDVTGWTESTVKTYIGKRYSGILETQGKGTFRIQNMEGISWENFKDLHSQVIKSTIRPTPVNYDYDVALSFAGEDRKFVAEVAEILKAYDVDVFYDTYEQNTLWGKDLYEHLDEVYRLKSKYCVMFISKHYEEKLWTNHERKSAQARAFKEQSEYILPIRIDDTEIPGIRSTVGYIDASKYSPTEVANLIAQKVNKFDDLEKLLSYLHKEGVPSQYEILQDGPNIVFCSKEDEHNVTLSIRMLIEAMKADQINYLLQSSIFKW